jgi:tripeptidyl-peptidase I
MKTRRQQVRAVFVAAALCFEGARAAIVSRAAALPASVHMLAVPDPETTVRLQIGLRQQNIDQLEAKLKAVSEPSSPDYGKYMSVAEVNELFKPAEGAAAAVTEWLSKNGVQDVAVNGAYVNFATTIGKANELLAASFRQWDVSGVEKLRTLQYAIPDHMGQHIELVTPTTYFGKTRAQAPMFPESMLKGRQTAPGTPNCARLISPPCMEQMYNYGNYTADPASGSRVGFGSFLNQSARQADLTQYLKTFNLPQVNFTSVLINDGLDHQDPRGDIGEANLDSQFMAAAAKTLPLTQFITGGSP